MFLIYKREKWEKVKFSKKYCLVDYTQFTQKRFSI